MKMDGKINKKELLYKRALITCVVMLFVSIVLKLFGSTLFNLDTDIPILQDIDKVIMSSVPLSFIYSFSLLLINGYLICSITTKVLDMRKYIILLGIICSISVLNKMFLSIWYISFLIDTLGLLVVCLCVTKDTKIIKEYILVFILNVLYQMLSLFIRDLGFQLSSYGVMISALFMIDYYIMMFITYLYLKKGDITLWESFRHFGSYLANPLWKKRTVSSKQCSSKCENDG